MRASPRQRLALFRVLWAAIAGALLVCTGSAWAQASARESAVKAAFLYKFAGFVEWPAGTFQRPDQALVIGVTGDDDVAADLEQMLAGRTVEGRPVITRRVPEGAAVTGVHVLYIGRRNGRLKETMESVPGPVLVVTSQPGALQQGSVLNFFEEGGRVRFSASLASAEARNLKLSSRLLAVAQNVEGRK
jgi:hypothetical protein